MIKIISSNSKIFPSIQNYLIWLKIISILLFLQASISEVKFHPTQPDHVFTCSQGGEVCHWNSSSVRRGVSDQFSHVSPWLSYEAVKHRVETHSLVSKQPLPVNTLDVVGGSVVFAGDSEAFYVLHNVIA